MQADQLILTILVLASPLAQGYPNHAECRVGYKIPQDCASIKRLLADQMKSWGPDTSCPGQCEQVTVSRGAPVVAVNLEGTNTPCTSCPCGQKCLYDLTQDADNILKGKHTTPVAKYVDSITFTFTQEKDVCSIDGFSTSDVSFAFFDFGTNYCNMRNLLEGAGLTKLPGYEEETSVDICMQYDKINCSKF